MTFLILPAVIFAICYMINVYYVTVFYHRALTHRALTLPPFVQKFVAQTGPWLTGIDPKGWVLMHRLHHMYSDTEKDPHSPVHVGLPGVALAQVRSYEQCIRHLLKKHEPYCELVKDLNFDVHFLNRSKLWKVPYLVHLSIGVALAWGLHQPLIGLAYFLGIMTHPVQGWMVNALAHRFGYRNFDTNDNSKNNLFVSFFVVGEGYQNNHHAFPQSANFGFRPWEIDFGYWLCRISMIFGIVKKPQTNT